jgi:hypothetical protein
LQDSNSRLYRPLVDTPYMFLEFARIAEHKEDPFTPLFDWIDKYGLLGLTRQNPDRTLDAVPQVRWVPDADWIPEVSLPPLRYANEGGVGDTFNAYKYEFSRANKLLTLYEAVLNRNIEGLARCFAFHERCSPEALRENWGGELAKHKEKNSTASEGVYVVREILDDLLVYEALPDNWDAYLMDTALLDIWQGIGETLSTFSFPTITSTDGSGPLTPHKLTSTLKPRNLLGAMYLQFYWLVTSAAELSRCKQCGRIISHAASPPGMSEYRKPRKDKEFCSRQCRQNHHYQTRVKPARKGKSA